MTFIEQFEQELGRLVDETGTPTPEIVRWASEKVLESYRNGITAGQKGATVKRQGKSRRREVEWTPEHRKAHGELVRRGIAFRRNESAGE